MIIFNPIMHLGRLLRGTGRLPDDIIEDLSILEEDIDKLGITPDLQQRAFKLLRRIEDSLRGENDVVWPVPPSDPPTVSPKWSALV